MWTCTFADPKFCVTWGEKPLYLSFPLLQENRQISTMEVLLCLKLLLPSTYTVPYAICGTFHSTELRYMWYFPFYRARNEVRLLNSGAHLCVELTAALSNVSTIHASNWGWKQSRIPKGTVIMTQRTTNRAQRHMSTFMRDTGSCCLKQAVKQHVTRLFLCTP
jgi:hypothetical protein